MKNILAQIQVNPGDLDIPKAGDDPNTTEVELISTQSVADILEVVFAVLGVVAFLIIVLAGLRFILSRGEPDKAAKARNTIIYAAVGLVIAVSAFTLVRFITESAG